MAIAVVGKPGLHGGVSDVSVIVSPEVADGSTGPQFILSVQQKRTVSKYDVAQQSLWWSGRSDMPRIGQSKNKRGSTSHNVQNPPGNPNRQLHSSFSLPPHCTDTMQASNPAVVDAQLPPAPPPYVEVESVGPLEPTDPMPPLVGSHEDLGDVGEWTAVTPAFAVQNAHRCQTLPT